MTLHCRILRPVTLLSYLLLVLCCSTNLASEKIDLSSPEATINTYCDAESSEIIQQCFHPSIKVEKRSEQRIWTECNIIDKYPTDKVGQSLGINTGLVVEVGDIEVVTEVRMIDPAQKNPTTRFWYLLRQLDGKWKIISISHISDRKYPSYD